MSATELTCIDLDLPQQQGFRRFISSWLYRCGGATLLVDPGPLSTIAHLCSELSRLGVTRLDYILLTHIHIDHAGGTGALLRQFPDATVICHPDGIRHLVAPHKLWEGSRTVLGALAEAYGEIAAVPAERIRFEETVGDTGIRTFLTPGHAQHHCSYLAGDLLFAGEVAGVRCPVPKGIFMRPATPPRFILEVGLDSLDRMLELAPSRMVFAHYGLVDDAVEHLRNARSQLVLWVRGIIATRAAEPAEREQAMLEWLMVHDPLYRALDRLPEDIRARERYFLGNTLRGMSEYVEGLAPEQREQLAAA